MDRFLLPPKSTWITAHCSELTVPFTIYDSEMMVLFGSADLAVLRSITAGSGYHPVATETGRGISGLFTAFHRDGNTVPYFETGLLFSVDERPGTVATDNPYAYVSELFTPEFMSGRVTVDRTPSARAEALRLLASAPNGGDVVAKALTEGGLIRVNILSPDVLKRTTDLVKSYVVARAKSIDLGLWDETSTLTVNPGSDYGAAITRMDFRPEVNVYLAPRMVLDNGHLP